jgi:hypothetical protein
LRTNNSFPRQAAVRAERSGKELAAFEQKRRFRCVSGLSARSDGTASR